MVRALGGRTFHRVPLENPHGEERVRRRERRESDDDDVKFAFLLRTTNDANGNSRQLLMVVDPAREALTYLRVGPEGWRGVLREMGGTVVHVSTIEVTPGQYRRDARDFGTWWYY